jgi:trans-aconitate 2-methyltransferase
VLGIDSSASMLERAASQARPGLRFEQRDLRELDTGWDLIFSHAVIQWVENHQELIPSLLGKLNPSGQLVVQIPSNHHHPSQTLVAQVASEEPFRTALGGWQRVSPVLPVEEYADLLYANGGRDLTIFEKVYQHVMPGADAIVEWLRGTVLIPYMERLPEALREPFIQRYRELMRRRYPSNSIFFGFRRILFAATYAG